ncbi:MAG: phenylalanine--tRNA ligase subunit beta, partial [Clostridia bacterium]
INKILGNDDIVLDIGITANRTDANSIYGIAREVAAVTCKPLKPLCLSYKENGGNIAEYISLDNRAPKLCPRYMAGGARDVILEESPDIIKNRLRAVGIRSINNIVDITNYVLIEVGQPLHAFDIETISGKTIVIRTANPNETITALDDKNYTLTSQNLVIANAKEAMAVAGVMGGKDYSILPQTKTIVLESARFARENVRLTSRALNLRSDSSARFEKGVDFYSQDTGLRRALALIDKYGWGSPAKGVLDSFPIQPPPRQVVFSAADIDKILGIAVPENTMIDILNALTIPTEKKGALLYALIPDYREDIVGINDIAEEIIRIYGYDHIDSDTLIASGKMTEGGKTREQKLLDKLKDTLVAKGACEIVTYSFITPKAFDLLQVPNADPLRKVIKLANPLGEDLSVMRTTLAHSMLKTLSHNYTRGNKSAKLFEVAKTYIPKSLPLAEYPIEDNRLAIGAFGEDFYSFKAIVEELLYVLRIDADFEVGEVCYLQAGRTAKVVSVKDGYTIGYLGEVSDLVSENYGLDKRVYYAELDAEYIVKNAAFTEPFKTLSKYQASERDLAVVARTTLSAADILKAVRSAGGDILREAEIFDVYFGDQIESGYKSVAIRLIFLSDSKTLTDSDINRGVENILDALKGVGAVLR